MAQLLHGYIVGAAPSSSSSSAEAVAKAVRRLPSAAYIPGNTITAFCIIRLGPRQNMRYCVLSSR